MIFNLFGHYRTAIEGYCCNKSQYVMKAQAIGATEIANQLGIGKSTIYKLLKEAN